MTTINPGTEHLFFEHQFVSGVDFSSTPFQSFTAVGSRFENCTFSAMPASHPSFGAGMEPSIYLDCVFDGSKIRPAPGGVYRFERCSLLDIRFSNWFCTAVEMIECTFSGVIEKAVFNAVPSEEDRIMLGRSINQFEGNDFSRVRMRDVTFRGGVDLEKQKLPSSPEYFFIANAGPSIAKARDWLNSLAESESVYYRRLLTLLENEVARGQRQLFIRPEDFPKQDRERVRFLLQHAVSA